MEKDWKHLKFVDRKKVGRSWDQTLTGFIDKAEVDEYEQYYRENWYVYFPEIIRVWEENNQWFCTMRTAESCD